MSDLFDQVVQRKLLGESNRFIAKELNVTKDVVFRLTKKAARQGLLGYKPVMPGFEISQVTNTPKGDFIQQRPERGPRFEMPKGIALKGVTALVDGDGHVIHQHLMGRTERGASSEDILDAIKLGLADIERAPIIAAPAVTSADLATIYICADWHIGLLSWGKETGTNYDLKIAKDQITEGINFLVANSPASEQAVVLGLGDLTHTDGYSNRTEKSGNILDVDGRWPRVLRAATYQMRETINKALTRHERVLARILPGNHDEKAALAVAMALELHYENEPRVTIDADPGYFWWWEWGKSLNGATHGDRAKMADLPLIMAARNPKAWGRTKFRYIHTGHIHTQTGIEKSGVTVESHQTPVATDAWHHQMGYGATRSMTSITLHKERGEIGRTKANIL
jgi:hypothetical protein